MKKHILHNYAKKMTDKKILEGTSITRSSMETSDPDEFNNDLIEPTKKTFTIETSDEDEFY